MHNKTKLGFYITQVRKTILRKQQTPERTRAQRHLNPAGGNVQVAQATLEISIQASQN